MKIDTNIVQNLTHDEKELFSILRKVIEQKSPSTVLRAAGGWVRDKLLGIPSADIDIMVDNLDGESMARLVTSYLKVDPAHVIKSNPEKSKFITTAKAYIPLSSGNIQEIDFAQARSEVYRQDSRIPDIKPATPQEDAQRRDLTINSCFYNINENKLEDFTGMGIKDLISDTIRTPEDPLKTFSDDPLRIFRVIRFAAKYRGNIDPKTYQAMINPQLRGEIKQKVSKERIGVEFVKMLKNPNAEVALKLLKDTGLWQDIIEESVKGTKYEGKMAELDLEQKNAHHLLTVWGHTMQVISNVLKIYPDAEPEKRITIILAALMHDIGKIYQDIWGESKSHPGSRSYHGHEEASGEISKLILKYLKIEPYIQQVSGLAGAHMRPHRFTESGDGASARSLRRFIREMGEQSLNWLDVFNLATADAYSKGMEIEPSTIQQYQELGKKLQDALASLKPIDTKSTVKPILDGNEVMQILNVRPGPQMKDIMNFVKELRDENPDITKEQATQMLKDKYSNKQLLPTPPPQPPTPITPTASKEKSSMEVTCPMTVLDNKLNKVNELMRENKNYEVLTILNELKEQYGNDENVVRLIAIATLKLLVKDEEYRHNELIQHIMDKASENFFDYQLCPYILGILLLLESSTDAKAIRNIADRMIKMAPKTVEKVIKMLPEKVYHADIKTEIEQKLEKVLPPKLKN